MKSLRSAPRLDLLAVVVQVRVDGWTPGAVHWNCCIPKLVALQQRLQLRLFKRVEIWKGQGSSVNQQESVLESKKYGLKQVPLDRTPWIITSESKHRRKIHDFGGFFHCK